MSVESIAVLNVETAFATREVASKAVEVALIANPFASEKELHAAVATELANKPDLYPAGWYNPPPGGIGILLADEHDVSRVRFDSLRSEEFWPSGDYARGLGSVGLVHVSPVDKYTGIIGDFGLSFYQGENPDIQAHMRNCFQALEEVVGSTAVGMQLQGLYQLAEIIFDEHELTSARMTTDHDQSGSNFGHMVPWTDIPAGPHAQAVINNREFPVLQELIRSRRVYIAEGETQKIPQTGAFTVEARLESKLDPNLPNTYFHFLVGFNEGEKIVSDDLYKVMRALNMRYMFEGENRG